MKTLNNPYMQDGTISAIIQLIERNGGKPYFVGGCVRDIIIKKMSKDIDIEVFGLTIEELHQILNKEFDINIVGKSFGVFKIDNLVDISIPRKEKKTGDKHTDFEIITEPYATIEEAASRRDFTINAIYMDKDGNIHDPYNGVKDLEDKILRHTSEKFSEDPLRVLRAMQFSARFDFEVSYDTLKLCRELRPWGLSQERVYEEWKKLILKSTKPSRGLKFLRDCFWIHYYPILNNLIGCEQDPIHHPEGDVWEHTLHCIDFYASNVRHKLKNDYEKTVIGFAVLLHDVGKPSTTTFEQKDQRWHAYGHEKAGVPFAESFMKSLTNEVFLVRDIKPLVEFHMKPILIFKEAKNKDKSVLHLAHECGNLDRLIHVVNCDVNGRPPKKTSPEWYEFYQTKLDELNCRYSPQPPIIAGRDLIEIGFKQGKSFKYWLETFYNDQLNLQLTPGNKMRRLENFAIKHGILDKDKRQFGAIPGLVGLP